MSLPVYVISLPYANARRKQFSLRSSAINLGFSFFDAVCGESSPICKEILSLQNQCYKKAFKRSLSLPELGCYMSHINVWKKIVASDDWGAIVLEDDADFAPGFIQLASYLEKCDISNLLIKFNSLRKRPKVSNYLCKTPGGFVILQSRILSSRTTGYLIGKIAASRFLTVRKNILRPVDMDMKHWWEHQIPSLVTEPGAVYETANIFTESSIEKSRLQNKRSPLSIRFYHNMRYQLNFCYQSWKSSLPYVSPSIFWDPLISESTRLEKQLSGYKMDS
ncbi:glycosyltransferase family 25 protein [Candidatus Liberibacter sp.]|uniref:glycosyltransferase family 25 protein n=1 Tax=Candidatus Liberibacter sp. TaxID=34022 RepID=UPI0015F4C7C7|nr:glycosyltransferase family 25 protein [Candidatus Liberibacter sp.]MBA5724393.1 glycosyltransferase family 25 protein [Candidatus Liberibacter sp.]